MLLKANIIFLDLKNIKKSFKNVFVPACTSKDSFIRALREVVPEMELFLENHGQFIKIVIKLIYVHMKLYISPFYKKNCILKNTPICKILAWS